MDIPLFKVTLTKCGKSKLHTVKAVYEAVKISLKDAKDAVDNLPTVLGETVLEQEASEVKKEIEAAAPGAKVTIERIE